VVFVTLGAGTRGEDDGDGEGDGDGACKVDWEGEGDGDGDAVVTVTSGLIGMVTVLISPEETGSLKSPNIKVICVTLTVI